MKRLAADLHIHTALSPCAAEEMTPPAIVARAIGLGLAMIAICDHNTAGNVAVAQSAAGDSLAALAGIEITTAEEVHVLGLFRDAEAAEAVGQAVRATLPIRAGASRRLLSTGCGLDLSQALALVHGHGGLAVAAHVDRPSFSVIAQLGFWPREAGFDAAELSAAGVRAGRRERGARALLPPGLPVVCGSDSHSLGELGRCCTVLDVAQATFDELALAFRGSGGRRCGCA